MMSPSSTLGVVVRREPPAAVGGAVRAVEVADPEPVAGPPDAERRVLAGDARPVDDDLARVRAADPHLARALDRVNGDEILDDQADLAGPRERLAGLAMQRLFLELVVAGHALSRGSGGSW